MLDRPSGDFLLEAIVRLLREELMPKLDPTSAFKARVAANALEIVVREMRSGPSIHGAERARLAQLLGRDGALEDLKQALCAEIAAGRIDLGTEGLSEHLWATTLDKLAVEQPTYASYRRVMETESKGEPR